jgi:hypothetical protein
MFQDHLPGGKHTNLSEGTQTKLQATPKTSQFAESVFGRMDYLMRAKPNLSTLAAEAYILFANNRTLEWLSEIDETEQAVLFKNASREAKGVHTAFKERLAVIAQNRKAGIEKKIRDNERLLQAKLKKLETYTQDIIYHGLWQSQVEVDSMLASYENDKNRTIALKAQLNFRKEVLVQQPDDKRVFNITRVIDTDTKKRKPLSVSELASNVKRLVTNAIVKDRNTEQTSHILVGKRVRHRMKKEGVFIWWYGKVISQVTNSVKVFNSRRNMVTTLLKLYSPLSKCGLVMVVNPYKNNNKTCI